MRSLAFLILSSCVASVAAEGIENVRLRTEAERSRLVFDLSTNIEYEAFQMRNPSRIVIDIKNVDVPNRLKLPDAESAVAEGEAFKVLKRLRYARRNETGVRVVLDLDGAVDLQHTLLLPRQSYGHRLVVDLYRRAGETRTPPELVSQKIFATDERAGGTASEPIVAASPAVREPAVAQELALNALIKEISNEPKKAQNEAQQVSAKSDPAATTSLSKLAVAELSPKKSKQVFKPARTIVVAIDAGHGGHDVGAIGPKGTYEKDIVLQISRELATAINKKPGLRAVLTRRNDHFVGLRDRMLRARRQQADLFLSIHADAFTDRRVQGSSVYVLSQHGASSEAARWLAENENAADLVGGVSLNDKDAVLKSVLIDLSQTASIDASIDAADAVLGALKGIGKVHKQNVQHAGFMVLKSPDIPSLLVETAFISNPKEEEKLRSKRYQRRLAYALSDGIYKYFRANPPPESRFAENRRHKVTRGDTLSEIAERYAVSMESIKSANSLGRDAVRLGEVLTIP